MRTRSAIIFASAIFVTGCASMSPVMTAYDMQRVDLLRKETRQSVDLCAETESMANCLHARNLLVADPEATPNMVATLDMAVRQIRGRDASGALFGVLESVLLGPEQSFRSCYRGDCVTTRYRVTPGGQVSGVSVD